MAKRKKSSRSPQVRHSKKLTPSQHDKRMRLLTPNASRTKSTEAAVPITAGLTAMTASLMNVLHGRIAFRLAIIFSGALLAGDVRSASAWFQAAGVNDDWDVLHHALISIGRAAASIATPLLKIIVAKFEPGPKLNLGTRRKRNWWTDASALGTTHADDHRMQIAAAQ